MIEGDGQVYLVCVQGCESNSRGMHHPLMSLLFEWTTDKLEQPGVGGPVSGVDQEKSTDQ